MDELSIFDIRKLDGQQLDAALGRHEREMDGTVRVKTAENEPGWVAEMVSRRDPDAVLATSGPETSNTAEEARRVLLEAIEFKFEFRSA